MTKETKIHPLSWDCIEKSIALFSLDDFRDADKVSAYMEIFSLEARCDKLPADRILSTAKNLDRAVIAFEEKPFEPEWPDLCRLHWLTLTRKVLNVLEFGSGYSTVVLADAMHLLHTHFFDWARDNIRCDQPFHVYTVEEDQRFLELSAARLKELASYATLSRSSVETTLHDNRIASIYTRLPNISPDLIYLDGPSQYATTQELNGFSFDSRVRMPMSADILRVEFFLEPGTLLLVDGRTQNARFLKSYLRRSWAYRHDTDADVHYFELQENPLGPFNKRKLDFCLKHKWLLPTVCESA